MSKVNSETFISVDVETAGPNPGNYSLLAIGACLIHKPENQFYVELKPVHPDASVEALAISGLDFAALQEAGIHPKEAMSRFSQWLESVTPEGEQPVFVAFNAPFDWMFVSDYFYRYLGQNPFGHKALDIKSFYMGMMGVSWSATGMKQVGRYLEKDALSHHALQDAQDQAVIFRKMLAEL